MQADKVFKALGDPTRRKLLDLLCEKEWADARASFGENLDMARQSATQHLEILEAANLVSTVKRGRKSCISSTLCCFMRSTNGGCGN